MKQFARSRNNSPERCAIYGSLLLLLIAFTWFGCGGGASKDEHLATLRGVVLLDDTTYYSAHMIRLSNRKNERICDYIYLDGNSFQQGGLPVNYRMNVQVMGKAWDLLAADTNLILREGINDIELRVHADDRYVIPGTGERPTQIDKLPVYIPNSLIIAPRHMQ